MKPYLSAIDSINYTPGIYHSLRVLSPALALLSILSVGIFYFIRNDKSLKALIAITILIWLIELPQTIVTPMNAWQLPPKLWYTAGFIPLNHYGDRAFVYLEHIPSGSKILSDDTYLHSSVSKLDVSKRDVLVVPIFSPEVKFLIDSKIPAKTASKHLREKGINYMIIDESSSPYFSYFKQFPFFRNYISDLKLVVDGKDIGLPGERLFEIPATKE